MDLIADILLAFGAIGAGLYCFVLGRRLRRFNDLETGIGGAVAVLSAQVDDLTKTLENAQKSATTSAITLEALVVRAEDTSRTLELYLASLHDIQAERDSRAREATVEATEPESTPVFARRRAN